LTTFSFTTVCSETTPNFHNFTQIAINVFAVFRSIHRSFAVHFNNEPQFGYSTHHHCDLPQNVARCFSARAMALLTVIVVICVAAATKM
jgi:hypothetical protein